jgi:8-oxo-dGTP pyrophosphatase MutT (NUDIX family)
MIMPSPTSHFGVYGLVREGDLLLVVRKARGPYTGWLDLPGGTPEVGEAREETLVREMREETSGTVVSRGEWASFDLLVTQDSQGNPIALRHQGDYCVVVLVGVDCAKTPLEDVAALEWLDMTTAATRSDLSVPLRHVLAKSLEDTGIPTA